MNQHILSLIRYLIKILGIFFFLAGTFLTLCMIFLRWWPTYLFPLMALAGIFILYFYKDARADLYRYLSGFTKSSEIVLHRLRLFIKVALITFVVLFSLITLTIIFGQNLLKQRNTNSECKEIVNELNKFYSKHGKFPESLETIISTKPLRQTWQTDGWEKPYHYHTGKDGKSFVLISSGKDQLINTEDDIIFKQ